MFIQKQTIIFPFPSLGPDSAAREARLPRVRLLMVGGCGWRQMTSVRETGHCSHHTSGMCSISSAVAVWWGDVMEILEMQMHLIRDSTDRVLRVWEENRDEKFVTYWVAKLRQRNYLEVWQPLLSTNTGNVASLGACYLAAKKKIVWCPSIYPCEATISWQESPVAPTLGWTK